MENSRHGTSFRRAGSVADLLSKANHRNAIAVARIKLVGALSLVVAAYDNRCSVVFVAFDPMLGACKEFAASADASRTLTHHESQNLSIFSTGDDDVDASVNPSKDFSGITFTDKNLVIRSGQYDLKPGLDVFLGSSPAELATQDGNFFRIARSRVPNAHVTFPDGPGSGLIVDDLGADVESPRSCFFPTQAAKSVDADNAFHVSVSCVT